MHVSPSQGSKPPTPASAATPQSPSVSSPVPEELFGLIFDETIHPADATKSLREIAAAKNDTVAVSIFVNQLIHFIESGDFRLSEEQSASLEELKKGLASQMILHGSSLSDLKINNEELEAQVITFLGQLGGENFSIVRQNFGAFIPTGLEKLNQFIKATETAPSRLTTHNLSVMYAEDLLKFLEEHALITESESHHFRSVMLNLENTQDGIDTLQTEIIYLLNTLEHEDYQIISRRFYPATPSNLKIVKLYLDLHPKPEAVLELVDAPLKLIYSYLGEGSRTEDHPDNARLNLLAEALVERGRYDDALTISRNPNSNAITKAITSKLIINNQFQEAVLYVLSRPHPVANLHTLTEALHSYNSITAYTQYAPFLVQKMESHPWDKRQKALIEPVIKEFKESIHLAKGGLSRLIKEGEIEAVTKAVLRSQSSYLIERLCLELTEKENPLDPDQVVSCLVTLKKHTPLEATLYYKTILQHTFDTLERKLYNHARQLNQNPVKDDYALFQISSTNNRPTVLYVLHELSKAGKTDLARKLINLHEDPLRKRGLQIIEKNQNTRSEKNK